MKKLGIMGGTFNPVHNGHIQIAQAAYQQFSLDKILFLPNKIPPHKQGKELAGDRERLEMISLAIRPYPYFELSTVEMERKGISYTVDTLRVLSELYADARLYFVIGSDSLHTLETWKSPEDIIKQSAILSAPRYPSTKEADRTCRERLLKKYGGDIAFIQMPPVRVSSSEILDKLRQGLSLSEELPSEVYEYIKSRRLYR